MSKINYIQQLQTFLGDFYYIPPKCIRDNQVLQRKLLEKITSLSGLIASGVHESRLDKFIHDSASEHKGDVREAFENVLQEFKNRKFSPSSSRRR